MDSHSPQPPHHHHHQHHQHHHHQQHHHHHHQQQQHHHHPQHQHQHQPPQPQIMVGTNSSYPPPPANTVTTNATSAAPPSMPMMMPQQHHIQTSSLNPNSNIERFPFSSFVNSSSSSAPAPQTIEYSDGSPRGGSGFTADPARKKRGRPRKYSPDGNISLALSPTPVTPVGGHVDYSGGGGGTTPSSEPTAKRRGRPPGSGKKQLDALGATGVKFTPHVILVKAGKDIASKIMDFAQQGPRTVCILSANGAICNVTLRQPAMSSGTVTYEGRFEIISLSGSFHPPENSGSRHRTSGLSISLAGSDGRVLGGGVAGALMAASPVQVIVGSFIADGKKPKGAPPPSSAPAPNMLNFGAPMTGSSPPSDDASSDSSDENGDSPLNRGSGPYGNSSQPIHNVPMYANMGWPNSTMKMHPN